MKNFLGPIGFAICLTGILPACTTDSSPLETCSEPRPEICTQQYDPVCGTLDDGSRKTYSTGCTACSDQKVVGWIPGECN
jgi:hypothetical protein